MVHLSRWKVILLALSFVFGLLFAYPNMLSADQREALTRRMDQVEKRLRAQFSALDMMLAQFQSTSEYLTGQLAGLANLTPKE